MKLYTYDHCPYCVRARLMFGLRNIPLDNHILLNDDEATPIALIGAKQVPILQKPDGSHMGESLDVVRYLDQYAADTLLNDTIRPEAQAWFDRYSDYGPHLVMPRNVKAHLPEFATESAIAYYISKKEQNIGSFSKNLAKTAHYLAMANQEFTQLSLLLGNHPYLGGDKPSMEDIIIFPLLRNLSIVRGIVYPENVLAYLTDMAERGQINLYFDCAM